MKSPVFQLPSRKTVRERAEGEEDQRRLDGRVAVKREQDAPV